MEKHTMCHKRAFSNNDIKSQQDWINITIPNEETCFLYFLDSIDCKDPTLVAIIENVKAGDSPDGKLKKYTSYVINLLQSTSPLVPKKKG